MTEKLHVGIQGPAGVGCGCAAVGHTCADPWSDLHVRRKPWRCARADSRGDHRLPRSCDDGRNPPPSARLL